uniref:RING-CH-type domain-containing protein n=2 Tax=Chenopodium quinoa TaxID=63459 RepID=A0A803MGP6_CHEQI
MRDCVDDIMAATCYVVKGAGSVKVAEAIAARHALQIVVEAGLTRVELETDSLKLFHQLDQKKYENSCFGLIVCDILMWGSLQPQISSKCGASSPGSILRGLSFKKKSNPPDGEKSRLLNSNPQAVAGSSSLSRAMWGTRCSSLSGPAFESSPSVTTPASARTARENQRSYKGAVHKNVTRSLSVPGRNIVIVRSPSFAASIVQNQPDHPDDQITPASPGCDNDEEIPEDEAICRICFEACEEENTLKMECSCKGALQLIHEDCAVKWFSIKRNKICDVCGQEVLNLPVTLLRISSDVQRNNGPVQSHQAVTSRSFSAWQDFVVLAIISIICYFFFIEQLLIQDLKTRAVVIAAPFAFALGLVASMLAVFLAIREYVWTYAAIEFAFVAVILCIFYSVLHLNAVYAVMLSSVLGFSFALSLNALYIHFFYWRIRAAESSTNV